MGGEKTLYSGMQQVVLGSSPRWRGKANDAGQPTDLQRDHPRVGGEK